MRYVCEVHTACGLDQKLDDNESCGYEMKLTDNDKPWCPVDKPQYLCLLKPGQQPPKSAESLWLEQAELLERLVKEANEDEIENANRIVDDNQTAEMLINLPLKKFNDPRMPRVLLGQTSEPGSIFGDWKEGLAEAVKLPPMSEKEATEEAESLTLESFLGRIL
jgi:hypothetical protein